MLLKKLIKNCPRNLETIKVKGLSSDTRSIKEENYFLLYKDQIAVEKIFKASFKKRCVCGNNNKKKSNIFNSIRVKNVRNSLGEVCAKFFHKKPKNIIAVTGTNGKSSVADFFHQILTLNKTNVATIGTLGVKKNF